MPADPPIPPPAVSSPTLFLRRPPGITARLFLAVLATAVFVVVAMAVAAQWSFSRGFVGYLNELALERMDAVVPRAAEAYVANGRSWEFIRSDIGKWRALLRPVAGIDIAAVSAAGYAALPTSDLTGAKLRLALLDADQRFVVGYANVRPDAHRRAIVVGGATVGWLATAPFESVSAAGDVRFERSQSRASWTMGAVSVLLAALIALWAARALLRPVRRVAEATHRLAAGDYAIRVDIASRDEVGQLAADFNRLALTLQRNEQMRRDFMADISHELRTPLGVLHGELEAMEDGVRPLTAQAVASLQAEVATLNKLVSDLYDLSLADAGAMTYRLAPVDLVEVLRGCVAGFGLRLADAGVSVALEVPEGKPEGGIWLQADARRLQQLFGNLLENAARYTDAGGRLRISVEPAPVGNPDRVTVTFGDSAPGVATEHLPRLFDRFYRVDASRNRASGGAGLGLAISRSIALAHGGSIAASASPLGGLQITLQLPLPLLPTVAGAP